MDEQLGSLESDLLQTLYLNYCGDQVAGADFRQKSATVEHMDDGLIILALDAMASTYLM